MFGAASVSGASPMGGDPYGQQVRSVLPSKSAPRRNEAYGIKPNQIIQQPKNGKQISPLDIQRHYGQIRLANSPDQGGNAQAARRYMEAYGRGQQGVGAPPPAAPRNFAAEEYQQNAAVIANMPRGPVAGRPSPTIDMYRQTPAPQWGQPGYYGADRQPRTLTPQEQALWSQRMTPPGFYRPG